MDTRSMILRAAFELFEEKPFKSVSAQRIAERAGVSRKTLYNHFRDKYELMHVCYTRYVEENILNGFTGSNIEHVNTGVFSFMMEHQRFFKNVFDVEGQDSFWDFLRRYSTDFMTRVYLQDNNRTELKEAEKLSLLFIVEGSLAVCKQIILENTDMTPEALSKLMDELIPGKYRNLPEESQKGMTD